MPYPCSHFYFDINFGDRLYSKEKRPGFDIKVKLTTWIGHNIVNAKIIRFKERFQLENLTR